LHSAEQGLQSGRAVFARALAAFAPPDAVTVADFTARHRLLNNPGVNVGRWQHDETPYLVEPMELLTSTRHLAVVVPGAARSGKTSIAENWLLYSVGADPAHLLWYMPSEPALEAYVKQEINPMIERHALLRERLGRDRSDQSLGFKRFRGMVAQFLTVAYNNLISKTATRIVLDEIDAYPENLGDAYGLADLRRQQAGSASMVLAVSHPDRATSLAEDGWNAGIMRLFARSDRRLWYWPCPHCECYSSPNPTAARVMVLDYPQDAELDEIAARTVLLCPCCGAAIEDHHRRAMNRRGRWVGLGQSIAEDGTVTGELAHRDFAGCWIVGVMSPFVIGGIGGLARAVEEARREYFKAPSAEGLEAWKDVVVKRLGIPFDPPRRQGQVAVETLIDRAEPGLALRVVPEGVRFITVAIDVQARRFEMLARGWGERGESWIIEHRSIAADTSTSPSDWSDLFAMVAGLAYPLADGSGRCMRVRAVGCDSGGAAGATLRAYDAWRQAQAARIAHLSGRVNGLEAWTLLLLKGASTPNPPTIQITYPDAVRKDRLAAARGQIPLGVFAPNRFKDDLAAQLQIGEAGQGYVHFPAGLKSPSEPHVFFAQLVAETRQPNGRWIKASPGARNEATDLMVMSHAMAHLWGVSRIDWTKPPAWAAAWDDNTMVVEAPAAIAAAEDGPEPAEIVVQPVAAKPAPRRSMLADLWR
jgi:phage terminase large subunit GpA-like protein